ncbi:MAG: endonuclease domain-containing protein [bacterium]
MKKKKRKYSMMLRSRELRKEMTEAEQVLWEHLRNRKLFNMKFRRQYVFERFIVDFYCAERRLAVELDGSIHNSPDQHRYDLIRQKELENNDIEVLRFRNTQILDDKKLNKVLQAIKEKLNPSPSSMEKGDRNKACNQEKPGMRIRAR